MSIGYVKMYRALAQSDLWLAEPFTKGQAWADLILNANFRDRTAFIAGQQIPVSRGQLAWSEVTLAKRWKWSRGKVRRFLKLLKNDEKIEQQTVQHTSVITICNYEKFQTSDTADGTPDKTPNRTTDGTQEKKGNKGKNNYTDDFESAWAEYPKREGGNPKAKAFAAWNARLRAGHSEEDLTEGVRRYARFCRAKGQIGTQYVKQASSFFGPDEHFLESWEVAKPSPVAGEAGGSKLDLAQMRKDLGLPALGSAS